MNEAVPYTQNDFYQNSEHQLMNQQLAYGNQGQQKPYKEDSTRKHKQDIYADQMQSSRLQQMEMVKQQEEQFQQFQYLHQYANFGQ